VPETMKTHPSSLNSVTSFVFFAFFAIVSVP
jgi:hypothetical protein